MVLIEAFFDGAFSFINFEKILSYASSLIRLAITVGILSFYRSYNDALVSSYKHNTSTRKLSETISVHLLGTFEVFEK